MKANQPLISSDKIAAFVAAFLPWLAWLTRIALLLDAPRRSKRLKRFVRRCERTAERLVFLMAVERMGSPPPRRTRRPASAPRGFTRSRSNLQRFFRHGRLRLHGGSLTQRLARITDIMAAPDAYIARFMRTMRRGVGRSRLIIAAPRAEPVRALAAPAILAADSS
ncbi:hypothetical protein [Terricaulis sp.]|uniref:hypothetical protein n=1 Tax=Terricaulis sp. TaxID=2768686 RepID=UPI002AC4C551|nr:hypothetical protein [Terricaulis sp.]MDZ4691797.1 hypothetical protein [Terricaulis sp.]